MEHFDTPYTIYVESISTVLRGIIFRVSHVK